PKLLKTAVGRVVPLLPVAPDRSSGELEASVDKLFDEGGIGEQAEQGHFVSSGQGADIQPVSPTEEVVAEDVVPLQPRPQKKRKIVVTGASEPSKRGSGEQAEQGHFARGGQGADIQPVSPTEEVVAEDAVPLQPRPQKKRKIVVTGASEPSHPPKKLWG
nr:hypothetical protein [Tanacetum cinerariifolium]